MPINNQGGVRWGTYQTLPHRPHFQAITDDPMLTPHVGQPYFRSYVTNIQGKAPLSLELVNGGLAVAPDADCARHMTIFGSTGSGKSCAMERAALEHLESGHSCLFIDPKGQGADRLLMRVCARGMDPATVTIVDPELPAPGFNSLNTGLPAGEVASELASLLRSLDSSVAPRTDDVLTNGLGLAALNAGSLLELGQLLVRRDYCEGLLQQPVETVDPYYHQEIRSFFIHEFWARSASEMVSTVAASRRRIREYLRNPYLRAVTTARRNTISLDSLWDRQQLIIVRLRPSIGDVGARTLCAMLIRLLLRTALRRTSRSRDVLLAIDELPWLEGLVGDVISELVAVARSQGLRLVSGSQHLKQLSTELLAALLNNSSVQLFFRMAHADAQIVSASLAAGSETQLSRVFVSAERKQGQLLYATVHYDIEDDSGRPLRVSPLTWQSLGWDILLSPEPLLALRRLAERTGFRRLYVRTPDGPAPLHRFVSRGDCVHTIEGPRLRLCLSFPRPKFTRVDNWTETDEAHAWTRTLQGLEVQHCVLRIAGSQKGLVKIADMPEPKVSPRALQRFIQASVAANAQSPEEIEASWRWRLERIEQVAAGSAVQHTSRAPGRPRNSAAKTADIKAADENAPADDASVATDITVMGMDGPGPTGEADDGSIF